MIVVFSNVKGGVGKTTLCAMFATWLAEHGYPVVAVDADLQASLTRHRQREAAAEPELKAPWDVLSAEDGTVKKLQKVNGIVLVDCPGTLNDQKLLDIYQMADVAVVPLSYDTDTVDATGVFIKVLKKVSDAKLVFVPNRINSAEKKAEELRQREQTHSILEMVGTVTPRIKQSVSVKRYSTLYGLVSDQEKAVEEAFKAIEKVINFKK